MKWFPVIFVLFICIILSCQKDYSLQKFSFNGSVTDISYSEKTFQVSNYADIVIRTPTGLKVHFPAYAFINKLGQTVAENITIEVKEILKPDAMIIHKMATVSGNEILESGGEYYVAATSGSEKLELAPGIFMKMTLPKIGVNLNGMQVFNGKTDTITGNFDWQLNTNPGNIVSADSTANSNFESYNLFSDELEWINVDKFINEPKFDLTVYPGNTPNIDSTDGYIQLLGRNTLMFLMNNGTSLYGRTIAGSTAIIGIYRSNGVLKASIQKMNINSGQSSTMNFVTMSEAELKQKLKALR